MTDRQFAEDGDDLKTQKMYRKPRWWEKLLSAVLLILFGTGAYVALGIRDPLRAMGIAIVILSIVQVAIWWLRGERIRDVYPTLGSIHSWVEDRR